MKDKARIIIEDILDLILNDSRYDLQGAEYKLWVSFRKKSRTLCITPTIIHKHMDNLKWFHLILFNKIREALHKAEWDTIELDSFLINTSFLNNKIPPQKLPEKSYTWRI